MIIDQRIIKLIFGLIIFMFSLALVYFIASYADNNHIFDYYLTLLISASIYILVGMVVYQIFPVSLGFLFTSDVLIIHLLFKNFGDIPDVLKTIIVSLVLIVLYLFAWYKMPDQNLTTPTPTPTLIPS